MIEITPIGVVTDNIAGSTTFYRQTMGIECVRNMSREAGMPMLRLESPYIEVDSTMIATFDRSKNGFREHNQRLRLICNVSKTIAVLSQAGISVNEENGHYSFCDPNGLTWHLSEQQNRMINH